MSEEMKNQLEEEEKEEKEEEGAVEGKNKDEDVDIEEEEDKKEKGKEEKSFTQKQVTAMMTKEKKQGRAAAYKELGINPKDTKMINMFKAFIASQKTDEEKEAERQSEEAAKLEEANNRAMIAEAKAEAMLLGVQPKYVEDIIALAISKIKDDDSNIKTIIGEYKTKYPDWFKESKEDEKKEEKKGQKGTGSSVKTGKEKGSKEETKGMGARLAAQRKTSNKKSSYWGNNK